MSDDIEPTDLEYHTMVDTIEQELSKIVTSHMVDDDPRAIYQALQATTARVLWAFIESGAVREELEEIGKQMRTMYLRGLDEGKSKGKKYLQ